MTSDRSKLEAHDSVKVMALRRDGSCSICAAQLPAGERAQWDAVAKAVTCLSCVEGPPPDAVPAVVDGGLKSPSALAGDAPHLPIDFGTPGASARKEHERRQAKREQRIQEKWGTGRLGRIAKALSDDPQSTTAWAKGSRGEELVAELLQKFLGDDAVLLHDRKVPGTRGNIDHIAVARSGVWVIDAKNFKGKVEKRDQGGLFKSDIRLYVGGGDRTKKVNGLGWQIDAVRSVVADAQAPVHAALSFVGAEWPVFFARPLLINEVCVTWPKKLAELILRDGPLDDEAIERLTLLLSQRLPAN